MAPEVRTNSPGKRRPGNSANVRYDLRPCLLYTSQTSTGLQLTYSTPFIFSVLAFDNYYTGNLTDFIGPMQYELDKPTVYAGEGEFAVPPNGSTNLTVYPNNAANFYFTGPYNGNSPSQTGLLLMYTDGLAGQEDARSRSLRDVTGILRADDRARNRHPFRHSHR